MKLTTFQLEPQLAKGLSLVYLLSGDEILLKNDALNSIRKAAKAAGISERIRVAPAAGFNWEELHQILHSNSLLAEKRLIEIDFRDVTVNKTASNILKEYADHPDTNLVLVIDIGKIDAKLAKSVWLKALEKIGHIVTIWPIPSEQLPQWIINRARKYSLSMTHEAANLLADHVEGNLIAAAQTIEKLYLLKNPKAVTVEVLQEFLTDENRFSLFDFIETLISGNRAKSLQMLSNLKSEGVDPILVLWAITRELRLLQTISLELSQGSTFESQFQKHRIFARRQQAVRQFLSRFNARDCWKSIAHAMEIDSMIKGVKSGDPWNALELFCLRVSG